MNVTKFLMKEYCNGEITVYWDPDKCIHATLCVKGLPQVFSREKKPWVNMEGASSEEIMSAIDRCPSGALSYKKGDEKEDLNSQFAQIRIMKNGPLNVEGHCILLDSNGIDLKARGSFALCRCAGSKRKPFCDGTHAKIGFDDAK